MQPDRIIRKLFSSHARLFWAEHHLETFEEEMRAFLDANPVRVVREVNRNGTQYVYRARVTAKPPIRISLLAGDTLHNLRACLDHLAWRLAGAPLGKGAERIEFPIFDETTSYAAAVKKKLAGVDNRARAIIERLQPYHVWAAPYRFGPPLLSALYHLSNFEKHRHVHFVAVVVTNEFGTFEEIPLEREHTGWLVEDGTELARFTFARPYVKMEATFEFKECLVVNDLDGALVPTSYLRAIFQFIRDHVLPQFLWFDDPTHASKG